MLPAVQAAREAARRSNCQSNLKQLGLAVLNYASAHADELPPGAIRNEDPSHGKHRENWAIVILPFVEQQNVYDQYDFDAFNEDAVNRPVLQTILPVHHCPSDEGVDSLQEPRKGPLSGQLLARGSYRANVGRAGGPGGGPPHFKWESASTVGNADPEYLRWMGPFHGTGTPVRGRPYPNRIGVTILKQVTDGLTNTLFLGESTTKKSTMGFPGLISGSVGRRGFWAYTSRYYNTIGVYPETRTILADFGRCVVVGGPSGDNGCKHGAWGSFHPGGLNFCYGDGSVRFHSTSIDMEILADRATMAGDELIR